MIFTLAGCGERKGSITSDLVVVPATASGKATDKYPVMTFDKTKHEFGQVIRGEKMTYRFKFINTGKLPLIVSSVGSSCGCTVPEYSKLPVAPGEEGFITVTFSSQGLSGFVSKSVVVSSNAQPTSQVLTITANVTANR
jgi:hypothetical protein